MTRRGRTILVIGLVVWLFAWLFGSRALYPVAAGLVLSVYLAVGWVRVSRQRFAVSRRGAGAGIVE